MKANFFLLLILSLFLFSCEKEKYEDSDFELEEEILVRDTITAFDARIPYAIDDYFHIILNDAVIGDTLFSCCSYAQYIHPPTTQIEVRIRQARSEVCDNILECESIEDCKRFWIRVFANPMALDTLYDSYKLDPMIATTLGGYTGRINAARMEFSECDTGEIEFEYRFTTVEADTIEGKYRGQFQPFMWEHCNADCD